MRAFFAIPMPAAQRDALVRAQRGLGSLGGVAWTKPDNFHLTLAFLGEVDDAELGSARERLGRLPMPRGSASLVGLGAFPSPEAAKVLWVAVRGADDSLRTMAKALQPGHRAAVDELFVPHVTIGRARGDGAIDVRRLDVAAGAWDCGEFDLEPVVLYESVRSANGSRYREVARKD